MGWYGASRNKTRSGILGAAGVYLLYLAYSLFDGRNDPEAAMSPLVRVLFVLLFAGVGGAVLVYAARLWIRARKEEKEEREKEDAPGGPEDGGNG